jgi:glycosyltransferase involved in cell wall biosynthesis
VTRIAYPRVALLGSAVMLARLAWVLFARRRDYAVIHAHIAHNMACVSALVGPLLGKRVVVKLTGMHEMRGGILDPRAGLASRLRRLGMRRATLLQATTERILVLPNGVDVARFSGAHRDAGLRRRLAGDAALVGVFVGRLAPEKGLESLVDAWARAFGARTDARLVVVGDGALREELLGRAERRGIGAQIVFAGHSDDVAPVLAAADFGLLTSFAEGLSNALLEYMAAGLPVIGSRVSGTEDFVTPGETGWLFEPGALDQLAGCLAEAALAGPAALAAMGRTARERIVARASRDAVTLALLEGYGLAPAAAPGDGGSVPCAG